MYGAFRISKNIVLAISWDLLRKEIQRKDKDFMPGCESWILFFIIFILKYIVSIIVNLWIGIKNYIIQDKLIL